MNKTAIKNFAVWARTTLINAVTQMAFEYDVTENGKNDPEQKAVNGNSLTATEKSQRSQLIAHININGFSQTMEEAAYTWFNRFIALRFMEVNNYLPSHTRIFSDENGNFKPEVLDTAATLSITRKINGEETEQIDRELVLEMLENQENERLYKYIVITQCNALNEGLPEMFEDINGWTELLFPRNLLHEDSVIAKMVTDIPEEDWKDQVQIIGWLYQYYNTEPKEQVFADLKNNSIKISANAIPAATQLFTPDWIVRYMVENSLGRLWTDGHGKPENADWKYYLDEAKQDEAVMAELRKIRAESQNIQPEQIKIIDPCMGSGHILVYAFDVLIDIYMACGWSEREAAKSILRHNLYGLDIDRRAYQLAYFSVMMKARQYNRRILTPENQPNLANFADTTGVDTSMLSGEVREFAEQFKFADTYGSLMPVPAAADIGDISGFSPDLWLDRHQIEMMKKIQMILSQKYDVVCTNPPYMGGAGMNAVLSDFVKKNYPDAKSDLYGCFIEHCLELTKKYGYSATITTSSWFFLSSFEKLRQKLISSVQFDTIVDFGTETFHGTIGHNPIVSLIIKNVSPFKAIKAIRLVDYCYSKRDMKESEYFNPENRYTAKQENFSKIPGSPVAYWVSEKAMKAFNGKILYDIAKPRQGLATTNNNLFLRFWHEIDINCIGFNFSNSEDALKSSLKWFPLNKGGDFRRWYGNNYYTINYENNGKTICDYIDNTPGVRVKSNGRVINREMYFHEGLTWSTISSGLFSMRYTPNGFIFETKGAMCFVDKKYVYYLLGLYNTKIMQEYLHIVSPTLDYHEGPLGRTPVIIDESQKSEIDKLVEENINISKKDWDSFETSWDFKRHPLLTPLSADADISPKGETKKSFSQSLP